MPKLGNKYLLADTGPPIEIADPSAAEDLLNLASNRLGTSNASSSSVAANGQERVKDLRAIGTEVSSLVLKAAKKRASHVKVEEWPGGEPKQIDLDLQPKDFAAVKKGRWTAPLGEKFDLAKFAGLPWCSIATLHSGGETLYRIVGPAIFQTNGWVLPVLYEDDPNAGLKEYEKEVSDAEERLGTVRLP